MTLAVVILMFSISASAWLAPSFMAPSARQSQTPATAPASQSQAQLDQTAPATPKPSSTQTSGAQTPATKSTPSATKKEQRQKKASPAPPCDAPPSNATTPTSGSATTSPQPGTAYEPSAADAQKNCPPSPRKKVVVHQGGVSDQSIQLAGGSPGEDTTQTRQSTNQMLAATEENLKKAAGIRLSTEQQSSVSQIRQFITQSKAALAGADFERARTLAWKAKVLSDDLVNPKK